MRTATTKEAEVAPFIKLPTSYIIKGAIRTIYSRHKIGLDLAFWIAVAATGWTWGFAQWLG